MMYFSYEANTIALVALVAVRYRHGACPADAGVTFDV
jgi:hypothetical protein